MSVKQAGITTESNAQTVEGRVIDWKRNKRDDVDGFYLENEAGRVEIHFPPHVSQRVATAVSIGADVQVTGQILWRAERIANSANGQTVQIQPPHGPHQTEKMTGKITDWKHNKQHNVDGFYLDGPTGRLEVHFPPHMGEEVTAAVKTGTEVIVAGALHSGPHGKALHVHTITNATNQQVVTMKPPHPHETATAVEGKIVEWKYNHHQDVDGLYLERPGVARLEVRFPPHIGRKVVPLFSLGDTARVTGKLHGGKQHNEHVRTTTITNVAKAQTVTVE